MKSSKIRTPRTPSIIKWRTIPILVSNKQILYLKRAVGFILIVNPTAEENRKSWLELKQQMKNGPILRRTKWVDTVHAFSGFEEDV